MFIKKLPYICQQMRKKEYDTSSSNEKILNEKFLNEKPKNPSVYVFQRAQVKKYINKELNLGLYALRDIYEGDELSICNNIDNLFEIFNEFNLLFPKELDPFKINFLRSLYLEKLIEKLNIHDLDNFELNSLNISLEERNFLNNHPDLISITQSLEYSILSHFSSSNLYPSKLLNSLKSKNNLNKITLVSLTKTTLKLFNLKNDYYNQIYLILSLEHFSVTLSQKLSMLLNSYRLFLLWINWNCDDDDISEELKCEKFVERFKCLQLRCLECVEFKCMVTLCAHYKFLSEICDKFKINKLI
ncbi:unnamed protein product [Rhizophagus irregularis]|nr:unnamed protein product [Rhizophagus irregularis]